MRDDVINALIKKANEVVSFYPDAASFAVYMRGEVKDLLGIDQVVLSDGRAIPIIVDNSIAEWRTNKSSEKLSSNIFILSKEMIDEGVHMIEAGLP